MEILNLPPLRNKELQTFTVEANKICKAVPQLAEATVKVVNAETTFVEAMLKEKSTTIGKKGLDRTRDSYFSGMLQVVKGERVFPVDEEAKKAAIIDICYVKIIIAAVVTNSHYVLHTQKVPHINDLKCYHRLR